MSVSRVIRPKARDLGGLPVRRLLPAVEARSLGPFVFLDQMGPAVLPAGRGIDVRPHPHIGLATLTWLVEGEIRHRDSLGSDRVIRPGEVNWMTAGRGIVHSERSPDGARAAPSSLFGLQTWLALPEDRQEIEPAFEHHETAVLPVVEDGGCRVTLVAGTGWGAASPVTVHAPTVFADAALDAGGELTVPAEHRERGVYVLSGTVEVDGAAYRPTDLMVLAPGGEVTVAATGPGRVVVLGGAPLDGPRRMWWNFVATDPARIERARDDWRAGRFDPVPGDGEREPLPGE